MFPECHTENCSIVKISFVWNRKYIQKALMCHVLASTLWSDLLLSHSYTVIKMFNVDIKSQINSVVFVSSGRAFPRTRAGEGKTWVKPHTQRKRQPCEGTRRLCTAEIDLSWNKEELLCGFDFSVFHTSLSFISSKHAIKTWNMLSVILSATYDGMIKVTNHDSQTQVLVLLYFTGFFSGVTAGPDWAAGGQLGPPCTADCAD